MPWIFDWILSLLLLCSSSGGWSDLALENLALRQQLGALQRGKKPALRRRDRAFWVLLARLWPRWESACVVVKPSTVTAWHRQGFRLFWRWRSRKRSGRPPAHPEIRALIRRMAEENPSWGAPRIHGELLKLGFKVSERTVLRYMPKRPRRPGSDQTWKTFLSNHREHLAAMDFFAVPTWDFRMLYGLVVLRHGRREVAHVHVTAHPTAAWVKQQLRQAFPFEEAPRYLVFDRDTIFGAVKGCVEAMGIRPKVTSFRSPWQNGAVERFIGTLRRDLLDHVIVKDEAHLLRLLKEYLAYYHQDRTHLGLGKDSPRGRPIEPRAGPGPKVVALPRVGGLHHRYTWSDAA
ncbi:MAG TPA: integrase core domain-containing protein [Holophagaceae bacterium]|nr:integrase core domain-containing protein [Holophagaceae bacterium]